MTSETLKLLAQKLDIFIVTYNRAKNLEETLNQYIHSPFSGCNITILDNCSTDNTLQVYTESKARFPNLNYVKNESNIGAGKNILKAMVMGNKTYTWIICDDDKYDFSYCDDVIEQICKENVSLIHMGAHTMSEWSPSGIISTPRKLCSMGYIYFKYASFIPCNIFKTKDLHDNIDEAYKNLVNEYIHMPLLIKYFETDSSIYLAKNRIVSAVPGSGYSFRNYFRWWLYTCLLISDKKTRRLAYFSQTYDHSPFMETYYIFRHYIKKRIDRDCFITFICKIVL